MDSTIELTSPAFANGEQIHLRHTRRGEGISPSLSPVYIITR